MDSAAGYGASNPTIAELRKNRFKDLSADMQGVAGYLEQLASQTGTNIDTWTLAAFQGILPHDRRAINRVFFAGKDTTTVGVEKITVEVESALAETKLRTEEIQKVRIADLEQTRVANLKAANEVSNQINRYLQSGWNAQKEIYAIQEKGASYIADDLKRVLNEGFWLFHKYENAIVQLVTKNDVIMAESNPSAGIERRVNLGKYLAHYYVKTAVLQVHRHTQNCLVDGHYHPYVNSNGQICWGNAAGTANDLLIKGKLYEIFGLLASLLVTYSPTATPYIRLLEFHSKSARINAAEECTDDTCEWCEETAENCDCCQDCETTRDNCTCCAVCGGNSESCDCCQDCERNSEDCDRCHVCEAHGGDCGCCTDCERDKYRLAHQGHSSYCEHYVEPEEEVTPTPIESEPAAPAENNLPF